MSLVKNFIILACLIYISASAAVVLLQRRILFKNQVTASAGDLPGVGELVRIKTGDGGSLEAWWVTHEGAKITLLYCHGNAATLDQLKHVAALFKDFGVNALLFDYRGYGASDFVQPTEETLAEDARAAYDWLKNVKQLPDSRIVIWGHSLGAAVASRLAIERSPAGLITEGAFTSIREMARSVYPWLYLHPAMIWDKFEVSVHLAKRRMPLLMLHAERDEVIPLKIGERAFQLASEPKMWITLKDIGHNDFPSVEFLYRERILGFINALPPKT